MTPPPEEGTYYAHPSPTPIVGLLFHHPLRRFAIVLSAAILPLGYPGCRGYVPAVAESVEGFSYYGWSG